jgi:hypothetical protein
MTVAFAFATDEELGWDETVGRTANEQTPFNTIKIDDRTYKIVKTISSFRAFSILGRATRIFIAQDVDSKDNERVVIKDIWADGTREREHEIQKQIQNDLAAEGFQIMDKYFFKHLAFGDVQTSNGKQDSTVNISKNTEGTELNLLDFKRILIRPKPKETTPSNSTGLPPSHSTTLPTASTARSITPYPLPLNTVPRVHYRLVMKEVGVPLQDMLDLRKCLNALDNLNDRKSFKTSCFAEILFLGSYFCIGSSVMGASGLERGKCILF